MTPDELEEARRLIEGTGTLPNTFSSGVLSDPRFRFAPRLTVPPPPPTQEVPPTPLNLTPFSGDSVLTPGTAPNALTPQSREERTHIEENWRNFLPPPYHAGQAIGRFIAPRDEFGNPLAPGTRGDVSDLLLGLGLLGGSIGGTILAPRPFPTPRRPPVGGPLRLEPRSGAITTIDEVPGLRIGHSRRERLLAEAQRIDGELNFRGPLPEAHVRRLSTRLQNILADIRDMDRRHTSGVPPPMEPLGRPANTNIPRELRYDAESWRQALRRDRLENHPFRIIEGGTTTRNIDLEEQSLNYLNRLRQQAGNSPLTIEEFRRLRTFYDSEVPPTGGEENLRRTGVTHDLLQDINPARRETRYAGLRDPNSILFPGGPSRFARPPKFTGEAGNNIRRTIIELRDPARQGGPLNLEAIKRHFNEQGIDISTGTIYNQLKNMKSYRRITGRGGKPRSIDYEDVTKRFAEGASVPELANQFNVRTDAIYTALRGGRQGVRGGRYLSNLRDELGLTRTRTVRNKEYRDNNIGPEAAAGAILRPGASPFDRAAKPPQYVRTSFTPPTAKDLSAEQASSLNRITDWLKRSGFDSNPPLTGDARGGWYQIHKDPGGTIYVYVRHHNTGEEITIRVPREGHYSIDKNTAGTSLYNRVNAEANFFDLGYRPPRNIGKNELIPEDVRFTRNVSGEPYAIPSVLDDALTHRLSRNPSGQFLIPEGRERALPSPTGRGPPVTEGPNAQIRFGTGRKIVNTQEEAINELKRTTRTQPMPKFDQQLDLPLPIPAGAPPPPRKTLSLKPRQHHEAFNPAEGTLFPGRTPFDRAAKPFTHSNHVPPQYGGMPHVQRIKFDSIANWLGQSGVPFRTKKTDSGTVYFHARDTLGKRHPENEVGMLYGPARRNEVTIRVSRDGHIGISGDKRPADFFDTGTWLGGRAGEHYAGRNINPFTANVSGHHYADMANLFDALSFRFSKNPSGQFLVSPGREYTPVSITRPRPLERGPASTPKKQFDFIGELDDSLNLGIPRSIMSSVHDIILREVRRNRPGGPSVNNIRASIRRMHDYIIDRGKLERYIRRLQNG